ncbi:MAG: nucleotidyltransferase family protein [Acidobacteriota bacterium]
MHDISNMQFHGYLEALIGSKISIRIVRALIDYPGKIFTVRKLAETAKVSASEAAAVVQQLEKYGALRIQPVGRSYLLTLNDDSYILNKILRPLIKAEQDTLGALALMLKSILDNDGIESAALFGSVAAGKEREDSDIDLLVISDNLDAATLLVADAQEQVSAAFNGRVSALIMSQKELAKKKNDQLMRSILANHVTVAGKDLKELISISD